MGEGAILGWGWVEGNIRVGVGKEGPRAEGSKGGGLGYRMGPGQRGVMGEGIEWG